MPAEAELEPVSRESTAAIVAGRLREAIMRGVFPPGSQLGEVDLAGRLGVSRGPLREAMQRLVAEGLLRSERHRGLFVVTLGQADVEDVYAARLAVERAAALRIMGGDRDAAVAELEAALDRLAEAAASDDPVAVADADAEFHQSLVATSGSPRLLRMAQQLLTETRMCLTALQDNAPAPAELVAEHRALVDAISSGDLDLLLNRLDAHMADAVARIVRDIRSAVGGPNTADDTALVG